MKIVCVSDLHGNLIPNIPECDLLLIGGDLCPTDDHNLQYQAYWLNHNFTNWCKRLPAKQIITIAGNHDFVFQQAPQMVNFVKIGDKYGIHEDYIKSSRIVYLQDECFEYHGIKIYGSPWQPFFYDWAFNLRTEEEMAQKWKLIPDDTNILVVHGPPHGYGDYSKFGKENTGSKSLLKRIYDLPKLKYVITGHIHESYGRYQIKDKNTEVLNASILNENYMVTNSPLVIEYEV